MQTSTNWLLLLHQSHSNPSKVERTWMTLKKKTRRHLRSRLQMMSHNFLTPVPIVALFSTKHCLHKILDLLPPYCRDVIYGRSLILWRHKCYQANLLTETEILLTSQYYQANLFKRRRKEILVTSLFSRT